MTASTAAAALPPRAAAAPAAITSAEYLGTFMDGSLEWHAARAQGLGGSDIAAVLGLSPWESRFSLWHEKRGMGGEREVTDQMSMGKKIEPFICDVLFAERYPDLEVLHTGTWRNLERPWQIANPDRLGIDADGRVFGIEAKNIRYDMADEWGEDGSDVIPVYYEAQVRHYMDTLGLEVYYVAAFFGGCDFKVYILEADERQQRIVRDAGAEFHRTVLEGIRPNLDGHTRTYQVLKQITEGCDQSDVEISAELSARFRSTQVGLEEATTARQLAVNEVLDAIGRGRRAVDPNGVRVATRCMDKATDRTRSLMPAPTPKTKSLEEATA